MHELIVKKKNEIAEADVAESSANFIKINLTALDKAKVKNILSDLAQCMQMGKDLKAALTTEDVYFLNVPKDIQKGLESGKYWFTKKTDTGEMLASVSHKVGRRKKFFQNLTVEKGQRINDSALRSLSDGMYRIAIQQQMAAITAELEDVHETVKRIENGQKDDRFGEITGANDQLRLALRVTDRDSQIALTTGAIQTLTTGSGKIRESLKRKIGEFKPIPDNELLIYFEMVKCPGNYKNNKDREFNEIQDYFEFYERAQKLLACASLMIDEPDAMKEVFRSQAEFLESLDLKKVQSIGNLHPDLDLCEEWFTNPQMYIETVKDQYIKFVNNEYEYISLEVSGKQLLEALDHDQTEEPKE